MTLVWRIWLELVRILAQCQGSLISQGCRHERLRSKLSLLQYLIVVALLMHGVVQALRCGICARSRLSLPWRQLDC